MNNSCKISNKKGTTLLELLIYLGVSVVVFSGLTGFLIQITKQRIALNNKQLAQHNARKTIEKMTYSLRNAYDVTLIPNGFDVYSYNYATEPPELIISSYVYQDGRIFYGQAVEFPPESLQPLTDNGIMVESASFEKVSSALLVQFSMVKNQETASINSTISFHQ